MGGAPAEHGKIRVARQYSETTLRIVQMHLNIDILKS
jgi:hypothetical protein